MGLYLWNVFIHPDVDQAVRDVTQAVWGHTFSAEQFLQALSVLTPIQRRAVFEYLESIRELEHTAPHLAHLH